MVMIWWISSNLYWTLDWTSYALIYSKILSFDIILGYSESIKLTRDFSDYVELKYSTFVSKSSHMYLTLIKRNLALKSKSTSFTFKS